MSKLKTLVYNKATNRSNTSTMGNTPKDDKQKLENISTVKMSFNLQYSTVAIEVFYLLSKKSYKLDIPKSNVQLLTSIMLSELSEPKSILDIDVDANVDLNTSENWE